MINLNSNLTLDISQELEMVLAPRMLAMLKTLQLPYHELVSKLSEYAEENVMLEIEREDHLAEYLNYISSHKGATKQLDRAEMPGIKSLKDRTESLEQHLLSQLQLAELPSPLYGLCEKIIENIDDQGYLLHYETLKEQLKKKFKASDQAIAQALEIIQAMEPDGVGARDLKECLLIQIREHNFENQALEAVLTKAVEKHLEDLAKQKFSLVARSLGISKEGVVQVAEFIKKNLNPYPGNLFGGEVDHIIPSFIIEKDKETLKVTSLEKQYGPVLALSSRYLKMLEDPKTDAETIAFLKEKQAAARDTLEQIQKRFETMDKTITTLVEEQKDFFEKGRKWLKAFSQKDLAQRLGVHPSTVSRTLADKYIQTPHGTIPLKMLCPRGKGQVSTYHIQALIEEAINKEDQAIPVKDEEIKASLEKEGITLKRRAITSHRRKLKIPAQRKRKKT